MKIQTFRLVSSHRLLTRLAPLLAAVFALLPAAAQAQAIEAWVQRYHGPGDDEDGAGAIAVDTNGNVVVTGSAWTSSGSFFNGYVTIKYSSAGVPLWTNRYNGPAPPSDFASALALDASGNVIVTGYSGGIGSYSDYATIKYSGAGVPLWTNRYNGPGNGEDRARAVAVDSSDNVIVTGGSDGDYYRSEYATIKYSSAGVPLWTNRGPAGIAWALAVDASDNVVVTGNFTSPGNIATIKYSSAGVPLWTNFSGGDMVYALALDRSGNVVVAGREQFPDTWLDFLTIKYSSAGVPLWTNRFNGPANDNDQAYAVAVDASGNVFVTGPSYGYGTIKYSSAGVLLWTNFYNGPVNDVDQANAIAVDASGNVYVTGYSSAGNGSGNDYATVAYSNSGVPLWTNRYNGPANSNDVAQAVAVDASGSVYVTGSSIGSGGDYDYTTIKYVIPPVIARQPLSRTNAVGTTANLTVEAAGNVPLSYQWCRQGTNLVNSGNLSGVTTTNLLIANVQLADAAGYTVVVTNAYGSVTSIVAQLTVTIPSSPGRFTRLSYSPDTGLSFIFREATLGQPYRIQTSPSLAEGSWTDWMTFTYNGPTAFTDLGALDAQRRFYRVVSP